MASHDLLSVVARDFGLQFVNKSVDYITADRKIEAFPGRPFRVVECVPFKQKSFRAFLERHAIAGASIQRRDFPLSAEELRKKYWLLESERAFLLCCQRCCKAIPSESMCSDVSLKTKPLIQRNRMDSFHRRCTIGNITFGSIKDTADENDDVACDNPFLICGLL